MKSCTLQSILMLVVASISLVGFSADVPAVLPDTNKAEPATDKPVKVYILAGQSNMVGFGTLKGARPLYPSIYLSADPTVVPCRMPVGPSALLPHGVYQSAAQDAPKGAKAAVYKGAYKAGTDYAKMEPAKHTTVALGTTTAQLPSIDGPHTIVATAFIEVPMTGAHKIHVGFEDSTHAVVTLDGKEVYRRDPGKDAVLTKVQLERGKRYPITVTYMKGGSAALWLEHVNLEGKGDLTTAIENGKFTWLADDEGKWTTRNDVTYWDVRTSKAEIGSGGPLSATSNGKFIGPEVPFGYVMGTYHDAHVLLIESSIGNRALSFDFRPPSSPKTEEEKANKYCGLEYDLMVKGVRKTLQNIDKVVPNYKGQGYEIVGFVWWQGHKDSGKSKEEYEKHLVNLIQDLRKEFKVPNMRAVVGTVGFHGKNLPQSWQGVFEAQMAVSDAEQHPELADKVGTVDTRGFWRSQAESPTGVDYHYNKNAETYVLTGDALGREMVKLLGGTAEKLTIEESPEAHPDVERIYSNEIVVTYNARSRQKYDKRSENPTREGYRKMAPAIKPIIQQKMIPAFLEDTLGKDRKRHNGLALKAILTGEKPRKTSLDIESQLDTLIDYYEVMGVNDYSWHQFGPEMRTAKWFYYSFDPPEEQALGKSDRYREITFPEGMKNWTSPDFNPAKADWNVGHAPFGQMDGKKMGRKKEECYAPFCNCHKDPATLWEKEVLLMQQTFDLPPMKEGHAYRVLLGGSNCDRSGEGFAVYVNGKLLKKSEGGFFRHSGIRGAYVFDDIRPEFDGGKVTIAVINFLRYTHFRNKRTYHGTNPDYKGKTVPPNGRVSLWIQEAKVPPAALKMVAENEKAPKQK